MNQNISSPWVRDIKESQEKERLRAEAERQRMIAASAIVESHGGKYWADLRSSIRLQSIDCKSIGVNIDISSSRCGDEEVVSIQAAAGFPAPSIAGLHLSYRSGARAILVRMVPSTESEATVEQMQFAVNPQGDLSLYRHGISLSPVEAAESIIRPLANSVLNYSGGPVNDQIALD